MASVRAALARYPHGCAADFAAIKSKGMSLADKTDVVEYLLSWSNAFSLFTRPPRFGKSLLLDTVRTVCDRNIDDETFHRLFKDTCVGKQGLDSFPNIKRARGKFYCMKLVSKLLSDSPSSPFLLHKNSLLSLSCSTISRQIEIQSQLKLMLWSKKGNACHGGRASCECRTEQRHQGVLPSL